MNNSTAVDTITVLISPNAKKQLKKQSKVHETKKLGVGGQASSTVNGHTYAVSQFDIWRNSLGLSKFGSMTRDEFANRDIFQDFGYFLAFNATKSRKKNDNVEDDVQIMMQSAKQYFSNWVSKVEKLSGGSPETIAFFGDFPPTKEKSPFWVLDIRRDISYLMTKECIRKGMPVTIRCKGVGKQQMILLGRYFLQEGKL